MHGGVGKVDSFLLDTVDDMHIKFLRLRREIKILSFLGLINSNRILGLPGPFACIRSMLMV